MSQTASSSSSSSAAVVSGSETTTTTTSSATTTTTTTTPINESSESVSVSASTSGTTDSMASSSAGKSTSTSSSKRVSERIANMHQTPIAVSSSNSAAASSTRTITTTTTTTTTATTSQKSSTTITPTIIGESAEDAAKRRRSSSRSIKRKKFDDELVDSMSTSYPKQKVAEGEIAGGTAAGDEDQSSTNHIEAISATTSTASSITAISSSSSSSSATTTTATPTTSTTSSSRKVSKSSAAAASSSSGIASTSGTASSSSKSKSKSSRSSKQAAAAAAAAAALRYNEGNNYWKPIDDLALIINVEQTNDLAKVHQGVKFSCKFSLTDIEARWHSLLYDINVKNLALAATRQLHPDVVRMIQSKSLLNDAEEAALKRIESRNVPTLESLQQLIDANCEVFIPSRSPKALRKHWLLLRHYNLLADQTLQPLPRHESVITFSQMEEAVRRELQDELRQTNVEASSASASSSSSHHQQQQQQQQQQQAAMKELIDQEVVAAVRKSMREIRMLENEIPKYQCMLDSITGIAPSDFDNQTYAVLRGRLVRYLMRSKEITIGRCTDDFSVDVDLSLEGPSNKISRLQAIISLQETGEFFMYNTGKRPIYIDSRPLLSDNALRIDHNSLIEFSTLKFMFLVNLELISNMRNEVLQVLK